VIALDAMRVAFPLPMRFDVGRLLADLATLRRFPQKQLAAEHRRGEWGGIGLHAPHGRVDSLGCADKAYSPTDALRACAYVPVVLDSLSAPKRSVRILALAPGARVFEHHDPDSSIDKETARLHVPIVTHPDVEFVIGGRRVQMNAGELWYGDFTFPHKVRNRSRVERVHLVIDVEVSDAIRALFPAGYVDSTRLRRIHRAARCWISDHKERAKGFVARALG
jgi:hypothetical protein